MHKTSRYYFSNLWHLQSLSCFLEPGVWATQNIPPKETHFLATAHRAWGNLIQEMACPLTKIRSKKWRTIDKDSTQEMAYSLTKIDSRNGVPDDKDTIQELAYPWTKNQSRKGAPHESIFPNT